MAEGFFYFFSEVNFRTLYVLLELFRGRAKKLYRDAVFVYNVHVAKSGISGNQQDQCPGGPGPGTGKEIKK